MRIKEVEKILGISAKNIRFYEKEGLLFPKRNLENGYREYSVIDVKTLKKIKLLRKLGISIENIRLLQTGKITLSDISTKQICNFDKQLSNLNEIKDLCNEIKNLNISLEEIDTDLWLCKMDDLENKGTRFMNISNDEIIRFLPNKFKMEYYESIAKNGEISSFLLNKITNYFEDIYTQKVNMENLFLNTLKNASAEEKSNLLNLLKENNIELYEKILIKLFNFEDIITLDKDFAKNIIEKFDNETVVKASMGASPRANEYLQMLLSNIDFNKEKESIGSIQISEIETMQEKIMNKINEYL
ncbi:MerR family transcriptional regulator [Clostridium hydrogenum]|uniref:MerR family transcriptional regulator n=1 Tax=Clostridium hydrogenum TaxID=2855764 RepID=UPI001F20BA8A|nr:MerR family transcriptional regulator [Clostridium hydrogenum]